MRTLGVDLAAQDRDTAVCAIEWTAAGVEVEPPWVGVGDDALVEAMVAADWVGVDAPFGWPDAMVEAVHGFAHGGPWPEAAPRELRYRVTDLAVRDAVARERGTSVWPLSVSSDRIAVCAWRCARLLTEYAKRSGWELDRVGGHVVEVYPAGALAMWGLPHKGYKSNSAATAAPGREKRTAALAELERAAAWLALSEDVREACAANDDAFDALVSSLVARAAATGRTLTPDPHQLDAARREGWIHLPEPDGLDDVA
jgi:predicted nuclease with RNAse H fold